MKKNITFLIAFLFVCSGFAQKKLQSDEIKPCKEKYKWGYCDVKGELVIPYSYEQALPFVDGYAWVKKGDYWGRIDKSNEMVAFPEIESYKEIGGGMFAVNVSEKWGLMQTDGKMIVKPQYDKMSNVDNGLIAVGLSDKWGVLDAMGTEILPPIFVEVGERLGNKVETNPKFTFSEGMVRVKLGNLWGLCNEKGNEVLPISFETMGKPAHGVLMVGDTRKVGFVDKMGAWIIPQEYEAAKDFTANYDVTMAKKNKKWGMIDLKNKAVTSFIYDQCSGDFRSGYVNVKADGKSGRINVAGQEFWDAPKEIKVTIPEDKTGTKPKESVEANLQTAPVIEPNNAEQATSSKEKKKKEPKEPKDTKAPKEPKEPKAPKEKKKKESKPSKGKKDKVEEAPKPEPIIKRANPQPTETETEKSKYRKDEFDHDGNEKKKGKKKKEKKTAE